MVGHMLGYLCSKCVNGVCQWCVSNSKTTETVDFQFVVIM